MNRVIFYFDGFNFYNGFRERTLKEPHWKNYYWLNLVSFCKKFIDENSTLVKVKYFTSQPENEKKKIRQTAFLNVNKQSNPDIFEYIKGNFSDKEVNCLASCGQTFVTLEEKKTDVAISVNMLMDCMDNIVDTLILVSADSDQVPTIKTIKSRYPNKKVKIYFPPERSCTELFHLCKPIVYLGDNEKKFKESIFASEVLVNGRTYRRPETWKY